MPASPDDPSVGLLDTDEPTHVPVALSDAEEGGEELEPGSLRLLLGVGLTMLVLVGLSYVIPGLSFAQPWRAEEEYVPFWNLVGRELMGQGAHEAAKDERLADLQGLTDQLENQEVVAPRHAATEDIDAYPPYTADDLGGPVEYRFEFVEQLDPFYAQLAKTDLGIDATVTRASHWGDSVLGNDGITSAIRRQMQARFGDAGHGFHSLSKYDASYKHRGLRFRERQAWDACPVLKRCRSDGHYGYGAVTSKSHRGAESAFGNARKGPVGRAISRFELWYVAQPGGGKFKLWVDGVEDRVVDARADQLEDRWEVIEVPDGEHDFRVRAVGEGKARGYGVVLERSGPGVVWDGMAMIGARTKRYLDIEAEHLARQLTRRQTNLLVFTFGGNDMARKKVVADMSIYEDEYTQVIRHAHGAKPDAACLIISPVDHGERKGKRIVTRAIVEPMVEAQRRVAKNEGCAFFDLYAAMGGAGSMGRWYRAKPPLGSPDLAHPTAEGHKIIGTLVYRALMQGYADFRQRQVGQPID